MSKELEKAVHVKPSYYAIMFQPLKEIALKYGYNLVLHGSLNRDMDLIAIAWEDNLGIVENMILEFCDYIGGRISECNHRLDEDGKMICDKFTHKPHGRIAYVIDIYRGGYLEGDGFDKIVYNEDPQFYLDISII